jgi:hypothetical protein
MLTRLTRAKRLLAGRTLALAYMLCVLMPALSFAFADGALAAPCLTDPDPAIGLMHIHEAANTMQHVHHGGHDHADHAKTGHRDDLSGSGKQLADTPLPSHPGDGHKVPGAQCCGMVCVSALPARLTEFVAPSAPASRCAADTYRNLVGKIPPTLYRPPIS